MVNWVLRKHMKWLQSFTCEGRDSNIFSSVPPAHRVFFTFALHLSPHLLPLFSALHLASLAALQDHSDCCALGFLWVQPMGDWKVKGSRGEKLVYSFPDSSCFTTVFMISAPALPRLPTQAYSSNIIWFSPLALSALGIVATFYQCWSLDCLQYPSLSLKAAHNLCKKSFN